MRTFLSALVVGLIVGGVEFVALNTLGAEAFTEYSRTSVLSAFQPIDAQTTKFVLKTSPTPLNNAHKLYTEDVQGGYYTVWDAQPTQPSYQL